MARSAGAYSPFTEAMTRDEMSRKLAASDEDKLNPEVIAATNEAAARDTGNLQVSNALDSSKGVVEPEKLDPGVIAATNKAAGVMKPGDYVWSDKGNAEAGGEQYHYNVDAGGNVQFKSPISGRVITLKPTDTAPHKQKAYQAVMKQIAQAQRKMA